MMNRGHVNEETAGQSDVTGDARAFLAKRFLGDLDDDILAGLQHFGNELRAAWWAGAAALVTAVMPGATRTPFETRSAAAGASAAIGTSTASIWASAPAVAAMVASAAAEWPLEPRTRIATDTRRVAWEIFARSFGSTDAGRTSFAGEENYVLFDDGSPFRDNVAWTCRDHFLFETLRLDMLRADLCSLGMFVRFVLVRSPVNGVVFGVFLGYIRCELRAVGGAAGLDFLDFFLGEFGNFGDGRFLGFFRNFFCLFFRFFFVEFGAADDGIGFRFFGGFFVLGFDETGGERGDLIFVQLRVIPGGFRAVTGRIL